MSLTADQARALAPDPQVAAAAQKLARPASWHGLGRNGQAIWGECRGSAVYRVQADLDEMALRCSCPSRKQPCKHAVGLLLLAAGGSDVPAADPPAWVAEWLAKRRERAEGPRQAATKTVAEERSGPSARQAKQARERVDRVLQGADALDLWLADVGRGGLAGVETQPASWWERQAARLVDAQAPGLAGRVRRMAGIPGSSADWPERLLFEMGQLALLTHALRRMDALAPETQHDVRRLVGWTLRAPEVKELGETVLDEWLVAGRWVEEEGSLRTERTWVLGRRTGRAALILQFAPGRGTSFPSIAIPGTAQEMELIFWPGACPQRAMIETRRGEPKPTVGGLPHRQSVRALLSDVAAILARAPWTDRFLGALADVVAFRRADGTWAIQDPDGDLLPLRGTNHWQLLAVSGGHPVDLIGEWHDLTLRPLGVVAEGVFHVLAP